jgi:hypothetical protein
VRGAGASSRDDFFDGGARNFLVDIYDADLRACSRKSEGDRSSDTTAGAGDDRNFAVQKEILLNVL